MLRIEFVACCIINNQLNNMLYKNQIINEMTSDPIMLQLSPLAKYLKDNSTDLWYDSDLNFLFVHRDLIKYDNGTYLDKNF